MFICIIVFHFSILLRERKHQNGKKKHHFQFIFRFHCLDFKIEKTIHVKIFCLLLFCIKDNFRKEAKKELKSGVIIYFIHVYFQVN